MKPTPTLTVAPDLVLRPAMLPMVDRLSVAITESGEEVYPALPWLERGEEVRGQLWSYLEDVSRMGMRGMCHHWAVIERGLHTAEASVDEVGERIVGLIALDSTPHLVVGHWNLGYWIRPIAQNKRLASRSIDAVLDWIGNAGGAPCAVEIRVDPNNTAGLATADSTARRWQGHRFPDGDSDVEVEGREVMHHCYLVPRLPLPHQQ